MIWLVQIENSDGTSTGYTEKRPSVGDWAGIRAKDENGAPLDAAGVVIEIFEEKEDWE